MSSHARREPAAMAGLPLRSPGAPSRRRLAADLPESRAGLGASALPGTAAARILEELDEVVRNSHRRSGLRRVLIGVGSAFAKRLSRGSCRKRRRNLICRRSQICRRNPTCRRKSGSPGTKMDAVLQGSGAATR